MKALADTRHVLLPLLLIGAVALFVRIGNIHLTSLGPGEIREDAVDYHWYAVNLLKQHAYIDGNGGQAMRMPGYPVFLAAVYGVFGQNVLAVQLVQSGLNVLACWLLFLIARAMLPPVWALVAAGLGAVYFDFFTGTARMLSESVYIFFLALFIFAWIKVKDKTAARAYGLGVLLGLTVMFRPEAVLLGAVAGLFVKNATLSKRLLWAVIFYLGIATVLTPWIVRNYRVLNSFVPLTSRAGASAYVGLQHWMNQRGVVDDTFQAVRPSDVTEIEDARSQWEKAKAFYQNTSLKVLFKSVLYNASVFFYPFHPRIDITMVFCMPLWLYGVWTVLRKRAGDGFLLVYLASLMTAYLFFGATAARYREPLSPATILFATIGLYQLQQWLGRKRFVQVLAAWLVFNGVLWWQAPNLRQFVLSCRDKFWA